MIRATSPLVAILAIGGAMVVAAACSGSSGDPSLTGAGLPTDCTDTTAVQRALFEPRCATAGCHAASDPAGALDLVSPGLAERVAGAVASECGGQTLVVPGDAESSYFLRKVADAKPACGARMPFNKDPLSPDAVACVRTWVASVRGVDGGTSGDAGGVACGAGSTACSGGCVDTSTSPRHCGRCDNACSVACASGACVTSCPAPTTNCAGSCVDTSSSVAHCGRCGAPCAEGKVCVASQCSCGAVVRFSRDVEPILTSSCADRGCHAGAQPKAGLLLTQGTAYKALVNVSAQTCPSRVRVAPGAVDKSYLMNKLTGVGMCGGTLMPKAGSPLEPAVLDRIRAWICSGAAND